MSEGDEPLGKNPSGYINTIAQRITIDFLRMIKRKNTNDETDEGWFVDSVEGLQNEDEDQCEKLSIEQELQESSEGHTEELWLRYSVLLLRFLSAIGSIPSLNPVLICAALFFASTRLMPLGGRP